MYMRFFVSILCLLLHLSALATDVDVVVVGTSPISLLEALYRHYSGDRVLIVEEAKECGGAWKSIAICGVPHADLGCHTIGQNLQLMDFLREYVGCNMVSMDHPDLPYPGTSGSNGFYFSKGCHELIGNLLWLIQQTDITLLIEHPLDSICVSPNEPIATVHVKGKEFTTSKVLITPYSRIDCDNISTPKSMRRSRYYHLYMLIEDPTSPCFSYHHGIGQNTSRIMNLTHFVDLKGTGTQLIVFQTHREDPVQNAPKLLEALKKHQLVHSSAQILQAENYIYEQMTYNGFQIASIKNGNVVFEMLNTGSFEGMASYISKWKQVLPLWQR
jgi:hypothetical protein